MNLPESEICKVAIEKLRNEGWKVYCEINTIDIVAIRDDQILGIEAKIRYNKNHQRQINSLTLFVDLAIGLIKYLPSPGKLDLHKKEGVGFWLCRYGAIQEITPPRKQVPHEYYRGNIIRLCNQIGESDRAGIPNLKGEGPAQECQRLVDAYLIEHPGTAWKELFKVIPNHYASANSMQQSLRMNKERLAYRDRTNGSHPLTKL